MVHLARVNVEAEKACRKVSDERKKEIRRKESDM